MAQGFIYVLHFDDKISHARHYIGCTKQPLIRLEQHACGAGSRLTRECYSRGILFEIGGFYACTLGRMRTIERQIKNQKHHARYCKICNKFAAKFGGCREYPYSWHNKRRIPRNSIATVNITSCPNEEHFDRVMNDMKNIMSEEKDALGFIPAGESAEYGLRHLLMHNQIALAVSNEKVIGYAAYTINQDYNHAKIHQCAVLDGWRSIGIGRMLIAHIANTTNVDKLRCTVREDLAANEFWIAIGFNVNGQRTHKTSGSTLVDYDCSLDRSNGELMNTFYKGEGSGIDNEI